MHSLKVNFQIGSLIKLYVSKIFQQAFQDMKEGKVLKPLCDGNEKAKSEKLVFHNNRTKDEFDIKLIGIPHTRHSLA
jgi:tRNA U34 2-thiouridine synthase MnmA/TrmU